MDFPINVCKGDEGKNIKISTKTSSFMNSDKRCLNLQKNALMNNLIEIEIVLIGVPLFFLNMWPKHNYDLYLQ